MKKILGILLAALLLFSMPAYAAAADVKGAAKGVTLNQSRIKLAVGDTAQLKAEKVSRVRWYTSDRNIVRVYSNGMVRAMRPGKARITAKTVRGNASCIVTVRPLTKSISLNQSSLTLQKGESFQLRAAATPKDASGKFRWSSGDPTVVTVDSKGNLSAVGVGKARIAAQATDGSGKSERVTVYVTDRTQPGSAEALIAYGMTQIGKPYRLGKKGPDAYDCIGFVYYALNQSGYPIKYMSLDEWENAPFPTIDRVSDLRRGDILVFRGHVGIYLGDGTMLDARPSAGGISISPGVFMLDYWTKSYMYAKRIF